MDIILKLKKHSDTFAGLLKDWKKIARLPHAIYSPIAINSYLKSHSIKKLQIGAGAGTIDSWLCTDIDAIWGKTVYLNATKKFPFKDDTFQYIFSEHMIEHITYDRALAMLRQCRRVLKPGGTIRIATPDLNVLLALHTNEPDPMQKQYIQWITDRFLWWIHDYDATFVINNAFRNWFHIFLYDYNLLAKTMQKAGFTNITRYEPGQSQDPHLQNLESHGKNIGNEQIANFETMVIQATCSKHSLADTASLLNLSCEYWSVCQANEKSCRPAWLYGLSTTYDAPGVRNPL